MTEPDSPETTSLEDVEILELSAELYPDQRRVRVFFRLSPFQNNLHASISLSNSASQVLAAVNVVNIFSPENEITLHIPAKQGLPGEYAVVLVLFSIAEQADSEDQEKITLRQTTLHSRTTSFLIP